MTKLNHSNRRAGWARKLGMIILLWTLILLPKVVLAHPADVYLQATYLTVQPDQIVVELKLSPAVLAVPQLLEELDPDGDEQIPDAAWQTYVGNVVQSLTLQVDGTALPLTVTAVETPAYLNLQAGYGEIRITLSALLPKAPNDLTKGTHEIVYRNDFSPIGAAYQVNAFVEQGTEDNIAITLGTQNRDDLQQRMTVAYTIAGVTPVVVVDTDEPTTDTSPMTDLTMALGFGPTATGPGEQLLHYLYEPISSPWVLILALALAVVLGGLHALTPGHGKTLVAAYLVGNRGTVRHAIALGSIVTFTHTASVVVIGLLALFASQYIVPGVLLPALTVLSGLLVIFLGARLLWQRWGILRNESQDIHTHGDGHTHTHEHTHNHIHNHDHAITHHHGDGHVHTHLPPVDDITLSSLLTMGVSGGLVPCPEALGIMVIAIGLNRILLGLGLIVSFSFGLAAVLIVIGVLLVRSRWLLERAGGIGGRWSSALPLASAVIVTVLGVGIMLSGLMNYLG